MTAVIRQNYDEITEAAINKQINMELYASYFYLSMVSSCALFGKRLSMQSANWFLFRSDRFCWRQGIVVKMFVNKIVCKFKRLNC